MSDDDFMTRYGNSVLLQYQMPTEEEISRLEEWDADEENDNDDKGGTGDDEGDEDENE